MDSTYLDEDGDEGPIGKHQTVAETQVAIHLILQEFDELAWNTMHNDK